MGTGQLATLIMQGFDGPVYPIHPTEKTVLGLKAYARIEDVPDVPDMVVMVLPTGIVPGLLANCGKAGVRAAVVTSGGFREVGGDGFALERELTAVAREYDIAMIGPNCIGVSNFNIGLNTTYYPYEQEEGGVTVISQSGTYSCHIYGHTRRMGIRLSHTASALYIEGIADGARFVEAAKRACANKPVVSLYVGGTEAGARAGMSHTGAMAGDDAIYDGMLRQCGIQRATSIEEMLDWCWALSTQPRPPGNRLCVLSNAGGPGASMADTASREGLEVPVLSEGLQAKLREHLPYTGTGVNPIDITFLLDYKALYDTIPRLLMESGEVDGIVMYGVFGTLLFRSRQKALEGRIDYDVEALVPMYMALIEGFAKLSSEYGKPVLVSSFWGRDDDALAYLTDIGVPVYPSPERAVKAFAALTRAQISGS